jgi:hypothetical protein
MRFPFFLFLATVAQPTATKSLKGGFPIDRLLESNLPDTDGEDSKIIGGTFAQPGQYPYFVDIGGMCDQTFTSECGCVMEINMYYLDPFLLLQTCFFYNFPS